MSTLAVFTGSLDPVTYGHLWVVEQAVETFDDVVVALGVNPAKKSMFSVEERLDMVRGLTRRYGNVTVDKFENELAADYALKVYATHLVRGIRNVQDFEYEKSMANVNREYAPDLKTAFFITPPEFAEASSSLVKGLVGYRNWEQVAAKYAPKSVIRAMAEKVSQTP